MTSTYFGPMWVLAGQQDAGNRPKRYIQDNIAGEVVMILVDILQTIVNQWLRIASLKSSTATTGWIAQSFSLRPYACTLHVSAHA